MAYINRNNGMTHRFNDGGQSHSRLPSAYGGGGGGGVGFMTLGDKKEEPKPLYDLNNLKADMGFDQQKQWAEDIYNKGNDFFDLFESFAPQYEYLAENAGVSDTELQSRLGLSAANFQAGADQQTAQLNRDLRRMGINPNSGAFAANATSNALQQAASLSANQNQVRQLARDEDWNERLQAAQMGLQTGQLGVTTGAIGVDNLNRLYQQHTDNINTFTGLNNQEDQFQQNYGLEKQKLGLQAADQKFQHAKTRWNEGQVWDANNSGGFKNISRPTLSYGF